MTTETKRRERIKDYIGPKELVSRASLPALEATNNYVFEEKHDGQWAEIHIKSGVITEIKSRVGLTQKGAATRSILPRTAFKKYHNGILIGELVPDIAEDGTKSGQRRLFLFDALEWMRIDLRPSPLEARRQVLESAYASVCDAMLDRIHLVEQRTQNILEWYDELIARKGEGLVIKNKLSTYSASNKEGKTDQWFRCKPKRTIDYVVFGQGYGDKGTPNVKLGLYKAGTLTKVMSVKNPKFLTDQNILPKDIIGSVVEVEGYEFFKSGAIRHGELIKVRDDKLPEDCTIEAAILSAEERSF